MLASARLITYNQLFLMTGLSQANQISWRQQILHTIKYENGDHALRQFRVEVTRRPMAVDDPLNGSNLWTDGLSQGTYLCKSS
jgi:hypothetical protein